MRYRHVEKRKILEYYTIPEKEHSTLCKLIIYITPGPNQKKTADSSFWGGTVLAYSS